MRMILVTVGTQLGFDRLIKIVDTIAIDFPTYRFIAQIGNGDYLPLNIDYKRSYDRDEFDTLFKEADAIVAHAGMGSIISAIESNKPIFIMPRELKFNEHRNDHQLHTFEKFQGLEGCYGFSDEYSLKTLLVELDLLEAGSINNENINFCHQLIRLIDSL
ncbi:glycosyltransferase [Alteromonas sp. 1_MG-2023]|uniref:glycosyltransferase n=1 Tax=Alteromonas sp. 1_MG-2023 TaxID=3062669 RepID=UPI0026E2DA19|nr:glycosyltransferase [Alteromonas sp. 1_MG-2023]MDO6475430.1 glycosyltransferase [Alteromonas sp. 1_MG-2023]